MPNFVLGMTTASIKAVAGTYTVLVRHVGTGCSVTSAVVVPANAVVAADGVDCDDGDATTHFDQCFERQCLGCSLRTACLLTNDASYSFVLQFSDNVQV